MNLFDLLGLWSTLTGLPLSLTFNHLKFPGVWSAEIVNRSIGLPAHKDGNPPRQVYLLCGDADPVKACDKVFAAIEDATMWRHHAEDGWTPIPETFKTSARQMRAELKRLA